MFHNIRTSILERMQYLENLDAKDRQDGTQRLKRLRQIPPETGRFLALLLAGAPKGAILEIGTSAGYSTLWLALACEMQQRQIITFELLPEKATLAQETFQIAEVNHVVKLVVG
ncbi:MAG: O-methyltransferase, partial [Chloroflexi bacterium]|nr:O-methyltransferase [Chloroflexota bacterium]